MLCDRDTQPTFLTRTPLAKAREALISLISSSLAREMVPWMGRTGGEVTQRLGAFRGFQEMQSRGFTYQPQSRQTGHKHHDLPWGLGVLGSWGLGMLGWKLPFGCAACSFVAEGRSIRAPSRCRKLLLLGFGSVPCGKPSPN